MILVIYSCNQQQQRIQQCLNKHAFLHDLVSTYASAQSLIQQQQYSLIIVEGKGSEVCNQNIAMLRKHNADCWLMVVASQHNDLEGTHYYEAGADDYLAGPINERSLIARIRSHLRRVPTVKNSQNERVEVGPIAIDARYHRVQLNGQELRLTAREFALLTYFCRHPNQVFSRNQLLSAVWGYNHEGYEHTVNTHVNRLRSKLDGIDSIESAGQFIQTVWGVGYKLNAGRTVAKALTA